MLGSCSKATYMNLLRFIHVCYAFQQLLITSFLYVRTVYALSAGKRSPGKRHFSGTPFFYQLIKCPLKNAELLTICVVYGENYAGKMPFIFFLPQQLTECPCNV